MSVAKHSFGDRLKRADLMTLSAEQLLVAIYADSPNSASKSCLTLKIYGEIRTRIGMVAIILRDYPWQILDNPDKLPEMLRIRGLLFGLPKGIRGEIINRLNKKLFAQSLKDNAEKKGER